MTYEEPHDTEITLLFEDARNKLGKVDEQTNEKKKQIVIELAKNLEGKIRIGTICMEIVHQLHGKVTDRFVRECLDEKYKKKTRVENARKQRPKKDKEIDKLAAVTPLNQQDVEEEEDKETAKLAAVTPLNQQKVAIVDADGRTFIQEGKGEPPTTADSITDKNLTPASYQQKHQLEEKTNHGLEECSSGKEPVDENREDALEKSSQATIAGKMGTSEEPANTHDDEMDKSILPFEFPIYYKELQNQMALLFRKSGSSGKVWFNGKIDIKTREVISPSIGRIEQQQQQDES